METGERLMNDELKLEAIGIFKVAFKILGKNINFIIFIILTSLPFWCFLVYYETFLQGFIKQINTEILQQRPEYYWWQWPPYLVDKNFCYEVIKLCFLYLVPLHLLELVTVIVIVDLSSTIYTEHTSSLTLKNMILKPFCGGRLKGSLVTFIYAIYFSTCNLVGLIWLVTTYYFGPMFVDSNPLYDALTWLVLGTAFVFLLCKYLEWNAMWYMGVVISILEEFYGVEALALSTHLSDGNERRGFDLMIVLFAWEQCIRLPWFFFFDSLQSELWIVEIGLSFFCLRYVLKWVVCVVYFHDCKIRISEKRVYEPPSML